MGSCMVLLVRFMVPRVLGAFEVMVLCILEMSRGFLKKENTNDFHKGKYWEWVMERKKVRSTEKRRRCREDSS